MSVVWTEKSGFSCSNIWGIAAMVLRSGSSADSDSDGETVPVETDHYVAAYASYPNLKTVPCHIPTWLHSFLFIPIPPRVVTHQNKQHLRFKSDSVVGWVCFMLSKPRLVWISWSITLGRFTKSQPFGMYWSTRRRVHQPNANYMFVLNHGRLLMFDEPCFVPNLVGTPLTILAGDTCYHQRLCW